MNFTQFIRRWQAIRAFPTKECSDTSAQDQYNR